MSVSYTIDKFSEIDDGGTAKMLIGFKCTNSVDNSVLIIDKKVNVVAGKTDNAYTQEALAAAQAEIDAWVLDGANVGKTWNPDSNALED